MTPKTVLVAAIMTLIDLSGGHEKAVLHIPTEGGVKIRNLVLV
jgi:hypothetical protein